MQFYSMNEFENVVCKMVAILFWHLMCQGVDIGILLVVRLVCLIVGSPTTCL